MARTQTLPWDPAEHLKTEEDMAAYLNAALEESDLSLIMATLGDIARARKMTIVAQETGLGRESLYKSLSANGNPEFSTVLKVIRALGLRLQAAVTTGEANDRGNANLTQQERKDVLDLLRDNIRDDYREAGPDVRDLPQQAVDTATPESLRAFLEIHEELSRLVDRRHIRTRYTSVATSTGGYGISYYRDPIISKATNQSNKEIQAVCLPTKPQWRGVLEVYFCGHDELPVESTDVQIVDTRAGQPVFRVRNAPTSRFVRQTIYAFRQSSLS